VLFIVNIIVAIMARPVLPAGSRIFNNERRWQGTGKVAGGRGGKGGTLVGTKDRTDKGNSLTKDTPRDAVTNALRLHLHNFAYETFKIKTPTMKHPHFNQHRTSNMHDASNIESSNIDKHSIARSFIWYVDLPDASHAVAVFCFDLGERKGSTWWGESSGLLFLPS
jgi:hypothetical protein